jgi:hypothetical protein
MASSRSFKRISKVENEPLCYICYEHFQADDHLVFLPCAIALIQEDDISESAVSSMLEA